MWKDEWINSKIRIKRTKIKVRKKHKETKEEKYEREKWKNFPQKKTNQECLCCSTKKETKNSFNITKDRKKS